MTSVTIRSQLDVPLTSPGRLAASLAVASTAAARDTLSVTDSDGRDVPVVEVLAAHGSRMHVIDAAEGELSIVHDATVDLQPGTPRALDSSDELVYLRPSRYCPSDRLAGLAAAEVGSAGEPAEVARAVAAWIHDRVAYRSGTTDALDDALVPLLTRAGVCRDFAHLGVALCRAVGIPARYVSVYAPGLDPMDAHAVFEAAIDGRWLVFDATMLAPRASMVRIATGRDAADTALLTPLGAVLGPPTLDVVVTVDPALPEDDPTLDVVLA